MNIFMLLRGLALGFAIAAPVGPIGVLCIRRTLADGRLVGFVTGLGAATADATYGAVAAFGVSAVTSTLVSWRLWIHLIGALFLAWLGLRTALTRPATKTPNAKMSGVMRAAPSEPGRLSLLAAWSSTVALTLTNPATILSFAAVFAGLGLVGMGYTAAALTVVGVFLGSALWWLILSGGVNLLRDRFNARAMRWVNIVSGALLLGFAAFSLLSLLPA
ncbi:MAG TPA: LysE family transporter [Ktedonobacterales bacterium]|nr:LysE family transporter [Ktedonobacterales bacterium]